MNEIILKKTRFFTNTPALKTGSTTSKLEYKHSAEKLTKL
jgi:hypothetical protein